MKAVRRVVPTVRRPGRSAWLESGEQEGRRHAVRQEEVSRE